MEYNQPLVSIIVPVYNAEKYLNECIDSIVGQTYRNLEIILINDGSKDSSGKICDTYAMNDTRIRVIHKKNGGVSSARNMGLDIACGEYIMFVDSDDKISLECIELLARAIENSSFDIACGGIVNSNNETCLEGNVCEWTENEPLIQSLRDHPYTFAVWGKLYHKNIIGETRFLSNIRINEDTMFLFEILCKYPNVINIKDKLYYYRQNADSASNAKYSKKFEDILLVSDRKYQIIEEKFPELIYLAENMLLKSRMNLLKILCVRTKREKQELESELIRYIKKNHKSYISMSMYDDKWLKIVRYNLYYVYKFIYRFFKNRT